MSDSEKKIGYVSFHTVYVNLWFQCYMLYLKVFFVVVTTLLTRTLESERTIRQSRRLLVHTQEECALMILIT